MVASDPSEILGGRFFLRLHNQKIQLQNRRIFVSIKFFSTRQVASPEPCLWAIFGLFLPVFRPFSVHFRPKFFKMKKISIFATKKILKNPAKNRKKSTMIHFSGFLKFLAETEKKYCQNGLKWAKNRTKTGFGWSNLPGRKKFYWHENSSIL